MLRIRTALVILAALVCCVAVAFILTRETPRSSPQQSSFTLGYSDTNGGGIEPGQSASAPTTTTTSMAGALIQLPAQSAIFGIPSAAPTSSATTASASTSAAAGSVQSEPSAANTQNTQPSIDWQSGLASIYALIPGIDNAPAAVVSQPTRSPVQQSLYVYGNAAGALIESFDAAHTDEISVLQQFFSSRSDSNAAAVRALGNDLSDLGTSLAQLNTPPAAASNAAALAAAYEDAGAKLSALAGAGGSDDTLRAAIETYNAQADAFANAYVALSGVFTLNSVTFSKVDAGSVFQFTGSPSL